jgi:hypothetical protein
MNVDTIICNALQTVSIETRTRYLTEDPTSLLKGRLSNRLGRPQKFSQVAIRFTPILKGGYRHYIAWYCLTYASFVSTRLCVSIFVQLKTTLQDRYRTDHSLQRKHSRALRHAKLSVSSSTPTVRILINLLACSRGINEKE